MAIPRTTAKKLCTDVEYRLVNESFPPHIGELSEKELVQRIKRARAARDKYRSLAERQNREARGRAAPHSSRPAASNQNTILKQKIFDEALARFEKRAGGAETSVAKNSAKDAAAPAAKRKTNANTKAPSLTKLVANVTKAVKGKTTSRAGAKASSAKSSKAPASDFEGASAKRPRKAGGNREAIPGPNPKGPNFPSNPHERGRQSAAFKRQQARRDSR